MARRLGSVAAVVAGDPRRTVRLQRASDSGSWGLGEPSRGKRVHSLPIVDNVLSMGREVPGMLARCARPPSRKASGWRLWVESHRRHECGKLSYAGTRTSLSHRQTRRASVVSRSEGIDLQARNPRSENLRQAPLAQSAERLHGKEKVYGSIP